MRTELVADALGMALRSRGPAEGADLPLGPGMSARVQRVDYGELARLNAVVLSIGRKGECWDNALADLLRHHQARSSSTPAHGAACTTRLNYCSSAEWEAIYLNADRQAA